MGSFGFFFPGCCEICAEPLAARTYPTIWYCSNCESETRGKMVLNKLLETNVRATAHTALPLSSALPLRVLSDFLMRDFTFIAKRHHLWAVLLARDSPFKVFIGQGKGFRPTLPTHWIQPWSSCAEDGKLKVREHSGPHP